MSDKKYLNITISLDSMEWTNIWLPNERADFLLVSIAQNMDTKPRVKFKIIEAKSVQSENEIKLSENASPFKKAIKQVSVTIESLHSIFFKPEDEKIFSYLKRAVIHEHIISKVLSTLYPIGYDDSWKRGVVETASDFLNKKDIDPKTDIEISGLIVATQIGSSIQEERKTINVDSNDFKFEIELWKAGNHLLKEMFEKEDIPEDLINDFIKGYEETRKSEDDDDDVIGSEISVKEEEDMVEFGEEISELVTKLQTTLDIRKYPIDKIDPHLIETGPTLIVVPVALNIGESKKPIERDLEDLERELGVKGIILENDPSRAYYIRFLVPRPDREFPELTDEIIELSDEKNEHYFGISLGQDVLGGAYTTFISEWPHLLVAGTTGSGKTTLLKAIIKQLNNLEEDLFRILIIDGKAEFDYQNIMEEEHFHPAFPKVLEGHEHAQQVLDWVVEEEIPRRSKAWREYLEKNKDAQNNPRIEYIKHCIKGEDFLFKPLIILIDEFAEIMLASRSDASVFEKQVQRIVQRGRSSLIHLILATQRPDAKVLKGAIKANLPSRISLALPTHHDSMTVLGSKGAEKLLGKGDLIFLSSKGGDIRLQGYNV